MRTALPYIGTFTWIETAADLAGLRLRKRAQVGRTPPSATV
jgi:hypothetical protein